MSILLSIAETYSPVPAGRYPEDGPYNAQKFRDTILVPELKRAVSSDQILVVKFDGLLGISSSFLEETFGGLIRTKLFTPAQIHRYLKIAAEDRSYEWARLDAEKYISDEVKKH